MVINVCTVYCALVQNPLPPGRRETQPAQWLQVMWRGPWPLLLPCPLSRERPLHECVCRGIWLCTSPTHAVQSWPYSAQWELQRWTMFWVIVRTLSEAPFEAQIWGPGDSASKKTLFHPEIWHAAT